MGAFSSCQRYRPNNTEPKGGNAIRVQEQRLSHSEQDNQKENRDTEGMPSSEGTWIGSWQKCGTTCTRMRQCQAWTFKSGWCSLYDDAQKKCGFTSVGGAGTTAGYSGCEA